MRLSSSLVLIFFFLFFINLFSIFLSSCGLALNVLLVIVFVLVAVAVLVAVLLLLLVVVVVVLVVFLYFLYLLFMCCCCCCWCFECRSMLLLLLVVFLLFWMSFNFDVNDVAAVCTKWLSRSWVGEFTKNSIRNIETIDRHNSKPTHNPRKKWAKFEVISMFSCLFLCSNLFF